MKDKHLIIVVGPTAVGKTALGIELANHFNTEIISCDSRQFFQEMKIGTAKPSDKELAQAKHHFIDSHSIHESYSVGDFERDSLKKLEALFTSYDVVVMVGGSGLYVKAVCEGLDDFPTIDPTIREKLNLAFQEKGLKHIQEQLKVLDPYYYEKVDTNNSQRMIRALEVCIGTGQAYSSFTKKNRVTRPFNIHKIGINQDRQTLYERINLRVDLMMQAGLLEDAKRLYPHKTINALQTVGYQEFFDHFDGLHSLDEAIELVKRNSRRYAKKQLTWFNRDQEVNWFEAGDNQTILKHLTSIIN